MKKTFISLNLSRALLLAVLMMCALPAMSEPLPKRLLIIDQPTNGPGGSNSNAVLLLLQAPDVDVLGITVATGDRWRDEQVAHALRMLEFVGRTDVGVHLGAAFPLVRTKRWTELAQHLNGGTTYKGAFGPRNDRPWNEVPTLVEGAPSAKPDPEPAVAFLIRTVRAHPHQVTIFAGGPLTNIALAARADPEFASLAKEIVIMGGSIAPVTDAPEWAFDPRHEFNFWFDPEAAAIVLREPWSKVTLTTIDVSLPTRIGGVIERISQFDNPAARYIVRFAANNNSKGIAWEELAAAAWLNPLIVNATREMFLDVSLERGASYGNIITHSPRGKPEFLVRPTTVQTSIDENLLYNDLVRLLGLTDFRARAPIQLPAEKP